MKRTLLTLAAITLIAAGCNKTAQNTSSSQNQPQAQAPAAPPKLKDLAVTGCPAIETMNRKPFDSNDKVSNGKKTYANKKYGYSFQYPTDWYVDAAYANDNFSGRGSDDLCVGGDLAVANYKGIPVFNNANAGSNLKDLHIISMFVYKVKDSTTMDDFAKAFAGTTDIQEQTTTINAANALKASYSASGNDYEIYLVKDADRMFLWNLSDILHAVTDLQSEVEQIVNSFQLTSVTNALNSSAVPPGKLCAQVITRAKNLTTGSVKDFPTACLPAGWVRINASSSSGSTGNGTTVPTAPTPTPTTTTPNTTY